MFRGRFFFRAAPFVLIGFVSGCGAGNWVTINQSTPPAPDRVVDAISTGDFYKSTAGQPPTRLDKPKPSAARSGAGPTCCVMDEWRDYREDNATEIPFNTRYFLSKKIYRAANGEELSGFDCVEQKNYATAAACHLVALSAYASFPREPIGYATYNADEVTVVELASAGQGGTVQAPKFDQAAMDAKLSAKISDEIKRHIVPEYLPLNVFIPNNAGERWKGFVAANVPPTRAEAENYFKGQYGFVSLKDLRAALARGDAKPENLLSDYYCYLVLLERGETSPELSRYLYATHRELLTYANDDGLIEAFASSLARLDKKMKRLNVSL